ncbi:MAG: AAA family ATPase [Eubacteriaceae bacterium]|nr:AAA family ATPase [Eubacteriaceae bacterium]
MIYKKLSLLSFGKFKNKHIYLQDGLNLIMGSNEAGKSTIHYFIEGMFYGFFAYGKKKKSYEDLQQKYKPWSSDDYAGALAYENDKSMFLIERNFSEVNGRVKVSNYTTGEDITNKFNFNEVTRMYEPTNHLNLSKIMYRNTVSIGQMNTKTEKNLSEEVNSLMANIDTGFSDISVVAAIKKLREEAEKIAGKKGEIKQIGQINQILEKTVAEKEEAQKVINESKALKIRMDKLSEELDNIKKYEAYDKLRSIKKYEDLCEEINKAKRTLAGMQLVEGFDEDKFEEIILLESETNNKAEKLNDLKSKLIDLQDEIADIKSEIYKNMPANNIDELNQDYATYNQMKEGTYKQPSKKSDIIFLILFILFGGAGAYLYLNDMLTYSLVSAAAAVIMLIIFIVKKIKNKRIDTDSIYTKYGFKNEYEYEKYCSAKNRENEKHEEAKIMLQIKTDEYEKLQQQIGLAKEEYDGKSNTFGRTINEMGLDNNTPYREALKANKTYQELKSRISALEMLRDETLSEGEYNSYKEKLGDFDIDMLKIAEERPQEDKDTVLAELSRLAGIYDNNTNNIRSLTEIVSQIKELTDKRDELLIEYSALNVAADVIEETAKEMHSQNSPVLNKKISDMIFDITNRYKNIKLSSELDLNVEYPETGLLVNVEELSQGTLEQLYFSLRVALADMFAPDTPLILDDSFVMYDTYRLENIIRVLYNISKKRQVLLLSCSSREKEILDRMNISYNLVTL